MTKQFDPAVYVQQAGWDFDAIMATTRDGVSDADQEAIREDFGPAADAAILDLLTYCIDRVTESGRVIARIEERGNGFPDVGDYVSDSDGNLYLVVETGNNIETNPPHGNSISAVLEPADWSDLDDDEDAHESLAILGE